MLKNNTKTNEVKSELGKLYSKLHSLQTSSSPIEEDVKEVKSQISKYENTGVSYESSQGVFESEEEKNQRES